MTTKELKAAFSERNTRALSQLISKAENGDSETVGVLADIYSRTGKAKVLGITGPPGAGKSTLIAVFIRWVRKKKQTIAVIAVDPSSPITGGALLGDRIRLSEHFNDVGVFVRSLSTRGKLGGLSQATREAVHLCDAFGFDYILIETVGVGQSEIEVSRLADCSVVVLVPESGDAIQTLKAGLLEVADVLVVNKADREGADVMKSALQNLLELSNRDVPLFAVSQGKPASYEGLFEGIEPLFKNTKRLTERRNRAKRETALSLVKRALLPELEAWVGKKVKASENPYRWADKFLRTKPWSRWFKP